MREKETLLQAGAAEVVIATRPGLDLSGYAARKNPSHEKHDDIYARALALQDGNSTLLLLTVDLLGLEYPIVKQAREAIRARLSAEGLLAGALPEIMIAATHTHSAPASMQLHGCGEVDTEWQQVVIETLVEAAARAMQQLQPARLSWGVSAVEGVAMNRRNAAWLGAEIGGKDTTEQSAGVVDTELGLVALDSLQNEPLACVINYTCHPVVLTEANVAITAEYPGVVCGELRNFIGATPLFLTGAAADINPVHRGGWDAVERTARPIFEEAIKVWQYVSTVKDVTLGSSSEHLRLPLQPLPDAQELAQLRVAFQEQRETAHSTGQTVLEHITNVYLRWADLVEQTAQQVDGNTPGHDIEIQTFRIGPIAIVAVPGELFVELGLEIKRRLKEQGAELVLIAGYANGNLGYIPTRTAYALGGYEVDSAHRFYGHPGCVAPEAGEMVVESAARSQLFAPL